MNSANHLTVYAVADRLQEISDKIYRWQQQGVDLTRLVERIEDANTIFAQSIDYAEELKQSRMARAQTGYVPESRGDRSEHIKKVLEMLDDDDDIIIG